ncbi:hypothetical protein MMC31_002990 [Peltigera leucophlebia]|nr:hypothetical protein [Peltigera leucophlebia]
MAIQPLLREILAEDLNQLVIISVYLETGDINKALLGKRAIGYSGLPNLEEIFENDVRNKKLDMGQKAQMLVTVSSSISIRCRMRKLVREHLEDNIEIHELEYQPPPKNNKLRLYEVAYQQPAEESAKDSEELATIEQLSWPDKAHWFRSSRLFDLTLYLLLLKRQSVTRKAED